MKIVRVLFAISMIMMTAGNLWGQDTLYAEYFTDGQITLDWFSAWEGGNEMEVTYWEGNPSGDNWVGLVGNDLSGGNVGTTIAGELNMTDYEVQANIYCTVSSGMPGSYHGLVARCDTVGDYPTFYLLRTDFDTDQKLQLRRYSGATGETIAEWVGAQIPGGVPTADSWHHFAMRFEGSQIWAYWDGTELSGSPFTDSFSSRGFFGIYIFNFMSTTETYCDDILAIGEGGAQPFDFVAQDNHYLDESLEELTIRPAENQNIHFSLDWDALNGSGTSETFMIALEIDDNIIYQDPSVVAEPNMSYTTVSDAWTATLGEHTLRWTIDPGNVIAEGNEDNNVLEEDFLVLDAGAPDFSADSAWVATPDTIQYTTGPGDTDPVIFVLHWSVPMGSSPSGGFDINLDLDGDLFSYGTVLVAQPGENYITASDLWTAEEGFHYFEWMIDANGDIDEFDEGNNYIIEGFDVGPVPGVQWDPFQLKAEPRDFRISNVYPNPFNPSVALQYETTRAGFVKLTIYDIAGREIAVLADSFHPAGVWEVNFTGEDLAAGTYFAVLDGFGQRSVQPLLLVK